MDNFYAKLDELQTYQAEAPFERRMKVVFNDPKNNLPFSMGQFILAPGQKGPAHSHETEIEIYIVLSGQGQITFDNKDTYSLNPDSVLYVPPGVLHETLNTGQEDLVFYGVFVAPINLDAMVGSWKKI